MGRRAWAWYIKHVNSVENVLVVAGSAAAIGSFLYAVRHWIKRIAAWLAKQVTRPTPDPSADILHIPGGPPVVTLPPGATDGVTKTLKTYIMAGADRLPAYTTTIEGFPGTRYLVERDHPGQKPDHIYTADRNAANNKWTQWYKEWKQRGFGGASGTGFRDEPPFGD